MHIPTVLEVLGFNQRPLTWADFEEVCSALGVKFFFTEMSEDEGMYLFYRGYSIILLNRNLTGYMLLWVAWHELAHCLLHPPNLRYFIKGSVNKFQAEANRIAACCVIPLPLLRQILSSREEYLFPPELMAIRCDLYTQYGI